jgi:hypothetical protein
VYQDSTAVPSFIGTIDFRISASAAERERRRS